MVIKAVISKSEFEKLRKIDTCTVSNAIERLKGRLRNEGQIAGAVAHCIFPDLPPVLGYAVTGCMRSTMAPVAGRAYHENMHWWRYVSSIPEPRIMVIQDKDPYPGVGALVGELHAVIGKALHAGFGQRFHAWFDRRFTKLLDFYERTVRRAIVRPGLTVAVLLIAFAASLAVPWLGVLSAHGCRPVFHQPESADGNPHRSQRTIRGQSRDPPRYCDGISGAARVFQQRVDGRRGSQHGHAGANRRSILQSQPGPGLPNRQGIRGAYWQPAGSQPSLYSAGHELPGRAPRCGRVPLSVV